MQKVKTITVPTDTHTYFRDFCKKSGWVLSRAAELALIEWVNKHKPRGFEEEEA